MSATLLKKPSVASGLSTALEEYFINSLEHARHDSWPYDYWLLDAILPAGVSEIIADLPIATPTSLSFYGRREANNASRTYFTPGNQEKFAICGAMAEAYKGDGIRNAIRKCTGRDVSKGLLRIEYCQDTDGFWLEPHVDISVKLFTMLIYLSDDPALRDSGTDIYDDTPAHNIVTTVPYEKNTGLIFIPGKNTWHGFSKRPIRGLRKSLIVNYVTPEWNDKWELA